MHAEISQMFDLSGKVALVTGGARHLGYDAAAILAAAGCNVALASRQMENAKTAAARLRRDYGVDVLPQSLDQTDRTQIAAVAERVHKWKGVVDILVNNAGGGSGKSAPNLFERDPEDIEQMIRLNLTGVIFCCREVGRIMAEQRRGKIINIASIAALIGRDRRMYDRAGMLGQPVDYAAAKAGVVGLTLDLAGFLAPMGVHVNAISPGGFAREGLPERFINDYGDRTPLGRMGRDGVDLKGAILFLASAASDYVTGHNLIVDGGFSIWH